MFEALRLEIEKIVYTSSVAVLGKPKNGDIAHETTPVDITQMIGHYKKSKFLAEQKVQSLCKEKKLPVVIVNPAAPVGPRDIKPTPTGKMVLDAASKKIPAYLDTGLNIVHVEDVAAGHIKAFNKGKIGESYNIGTGFIINNLKLAQKIIKIYKSNFDKKKQKIKIEFVKDRPGHDFRYALNSSKIKKKLGWKNLHNLNKALIKTIEWYIKNPKFYGSKQRRKFDKRLGLIDD